MGTNFPTTEVLSYFETGDKPTQAQFATFINGVGAIDENSPLNNFEATTNPTVNDDSQEGYSIGSWWVNTTTGAIFTCTNDVPSTAKWISPSVSNTIPFGAETPVASAATVDLGTIDSHLAVVGGTATTTSFGSSAEVGSPVYLIRAASSGWTITLSSNILCSFATGSLVSVADTYYWLQYLGTGVWRIFATASAVFQDSTFRVVSTADSTKKLAFNLSGFTAAVTRTVTMPDKSGTMAMTSDISFPNGGYFPSRYYYGFGYSPAATLAVSAGRLYYRPILISQKTTFTRVGTNVSTLSAGNMRLGIYEYVDGYPVNLIADFGVISTATTGDKEVTISQSLEAGIYALAIVCSGTPTVLAAASSSQIFAEHYGGFITSSGNIVYGGYSSFAYASLPAGFPGITSYALTPGDVPLAWLRKV